MRSATELIMEGTLCDTCGALIQDLVMDNGEDLKVPPGYPRKCEDCLKEASEIG